MSRNRGGWSAVQPIMGRKVALSILLLFLVACAGRGPSSSGDGGIRGIVLLGPTCPVETLESPCPDRPLADVEVRVLQGGDVVASVRSDGDGRYTVALDPGHYEVQAMLREGGPGMSAKPVDVTVTSGEFTDVNIPVDSGIR
jgi:Carboxypeptidase regulatory-like domain